MDGSAEERAANASLGEKDKKIFDFMIRNRRSACYLTSNEIAAELDASPSSVVRLAKKLGYENFAAMRRALQKETAEEEPWSAMVPHEKIKLYENLPDREILAAYSANIMKNLTIDAGADTGQKIIDAAGMILKARRVYIAGFRSCAGFARSAAVMLSCIRPGVSVPGAERPLVDSLIDMQPDDVMIVISFSRYSSDAALAARMAQDAGAPVIAMTDSYAAPVADGAAKVIISSSGSMGFFDSYISFMANMEKILILVSKHAKEGNKERLEKMEHYLKETGQY